MNVLNETFIQQMFAMMMPPSYANQGSLLQFICAVTSRQPKYQPAKINFFGGNLDNAENQNKCDTVCKLGGIRRLGFTKPTPIAYDTFHAVM